MVIPARHFTNTPAPHTEKPAKSAKTCVTWSPKYESGQFLKNFCVSGDLPCCKFCQRNADWKCADTCRD